MYQWNSLPGIWNWGPEIPFSLHVQLERRWHKPRWYNMSHIQEVEEGVKPICRETNGFWPCFKRKRESRKWLTVFQSALQFLGQAACEWSTLPNLDSELPMKLTIFPFFAQVSGKWGSISCSPKKCSEDRSFQANPTPNDNSSQDSGDPEGQSRHPWPEGRLSGPQTHWHSTDPSSQRKFKK